METRLYKAGAVQSVPSMASLVSEGYPTGGNPAQGIAATKPGDAWFYGIGEEIRNAILKAGLTPSNNDLEQLAKAIVVKADLEGLGFETGDFKPILSNTIPNGWLLANGAIITREGHEDLYQYAYDNDLIRDATEQTAYESDSATFSGRIFGPGDGSTTLQLPDLRGRSLMGALSVQSVGRYQPEQLPNITGLMNLTMGDYIKPEDDSGALKGQVGSVVNGYSFAGTRTNHNTQIAFNAYDSNNVYTDSGKVYPLSLALNFIIKT